MRIEKIMTAEMFSSLLIHIPRVSVFGSDKFLMTRGWITGGATAGYRPVLYLQGSVIP